MTIAGISLFEGLSLFTISCIFVIYFGSYFVKGVIGMGALSPAILFSAFFLDPHETILLALVTNAVSHFQFISQGLRDGDWRIAGRVVMANFVGATVGVWIFGRLESEWLILLLGLALGGVVIADMTRALARLAGRVDLAGPAFLHPLSALAGLISGVTGAGGMFFLAIYVKQLCPDPRNFRGTVILLSMAVVWYRVVILFFGGFIDNKLLLEGAVIVPFVIAGGIAGTWFYKALPGVRFFQFFQGVLLFAAVNLIWKGFRDLS